MSREIITWCDPCLSEGEDRRGEGIAVSLDGDRGLVIDLCPDHRASILGPVQDVLTKYGIKITEPDMPQRRGRSAKQPKIREEVAEDAPVSEFWCFLCETGWPKSGSFKRHLKRDHELPDQAALFGQQCPECAQTFQSFVGLRGHVGQVHGKTSARLFEETKRSGDQHGVVADRYRILGV